MGKVLVIGAGGVGSVAVHKMAMVPETFDGITLASRRKFKCDAIAESVKERVGVTIDTAEVDADNTDETAALIDRVKPDLVVNLALPYQDLTIMTYLENNASVAAAIIPVAGTVTAFAVLWASILVA